MTDHADVRRRHGFHSLRVLEVIAETTDTASFVFDIPDDLTDLFTYEAGQFCTVRVPIDGDDVLRCYSMSSAPATDQRLAVTVKRVPGGLMSNWLLDHVTVGDVLELTPPAGVFCERDGAAPIVAFCGGSGVTPVFSIVKQALATGDRPIRVLYANRDANSIIFHAPLTELTAEHGDRLTVRHHLDADAGFLTRDEIAEFVGTDADVDVYVCGPTPFMDLVVDGVRAAGVADRRVSIERFVNAAVTGDLADVDTEADTDTDDDADATVLTVMLKGKRRTFDHVAGDTLLEAARRAGLKPPSSCELGNCATCMALVTNGRATMRVNDALDEDEVTEGWVLTCQAEPVDTELTIDYDAL